MGRVRSLAYRRIPRQQSLDFIDYLRRGVSVRESPDLLIGRKHTRGSLAQLSIPDQWSYLTLCTIVSSEINNNKAIEWLQRGGRDDNHIGPVVLLV